MANGRKIKEIEFIRKSKIKIESKNACKRAKVEGNRGS